MLKLFHKLPFLTFDEGSNGDCKSDLKNILLENIQDEEIDLLKRILNGFYQGVGSCHLKNTNVIFSEFELNKLYVDTVKESCECEAKQLSFSKDTKEAVNVINRTVKEGTNGKIEKIIDNLSPNVSTNLTSQEDFYKLDGSTIKSNFMHAKRNVKMYESEKLNCSAVLLPFKDSTFNCLLAMPNKIVTFKSFLASLKEDKQNLDELCNTNNYVTKKCDLSLPRFKVSSDVDMKKSLENYGLTSIFDGGKADFSKMTSEPIYVSDMKHKAVFEFNEEGAEAAAVTAMIMTRCALMRDEIFTLNRPFYFAIINENGIPLFSGHIVDPSIS